MLDRRPTLLDACARAATAAEARFRVDYPNSKPRASRVVALDEDAAAIVRRIAAEPWHGARFLSYEESIPAGGAEPDARLRSAEGGESRLSEELDGADVAVMIATTGEAAEAASVIGRACGRRRIMTAGLVLGNLGSADDAVMALRPYASVLVVSADEDYVPQMLVALRA